MCPGAAGNRAGLPLRRAAVARSPPFAQRGFKDSALPVMKAPRSPAATLRAIRAPARLLHAVCFPDGRSLRLPFGGKTKNPASFPAVGRGEPSPRYHPCLVASFSGGYRRLPSCPTYRAGMLPGHVPHGGCAALHQPRLSLAASLRVLSRSLHNIHYTAFRTLVNACAVWREGTACIPFDDRLLCCFRYMCIYLYMMHRF